MDQNRRLLPLLILVEILMVAVTVQAISNLSGRPDPFDTVLSWAAVVAGPVGFVVGFGHIRRLWRQRRPY